LHLQFLAREGFDVGLHLFRLDGAGRETKQTSERRAGEIQKTDAINHFLADPQNCS
jgi:hypothetical protein